MSHYFSVLKVSEVTCRNFKENALLETPPNHRDIADHQNQQWRRRFWSNGFYHKIKEGPYKYPPVQENLGPAVFPPQDQPFPPGGPSVLTSTKSQTFNVGSSINFGENVRNQFGGQFSGTSGSFTSGSFGNTKNSNPFEGNGGGGFVAYPHSNSEFLGASSLLGIPEGGAQSGGKFSTNQGLPLTDLRTKYLSTLAKNPLFLVLKLLMTDPGLWVTSPVLYHGLAHTGIVKPFPQGFGIYGFRFTNNVPDSQVYGNTNILHDKP